ncbi:MAG: hypothetical protein J2P15_11885, partial [Micromonosporaceae bacterium]|nr:hypothetical protein [Micromonosporaceae bacterium]
GTEIDQFRDFRSATDGVEYERRIGQLLDGLAALPMPTIAAVQRSAVGAGLAIAAMCDLIIADQGAVFGAPIARTLGNCLSIRVVAALRQRLGASRTQTMLLTARLMTAESLAGSGFVAAVAAAAEFEAEVAATAERIASLAPLTLRSLKEMARRIDATELPDDTDLLASCYGSTDFHEGVGAFLEHRPPQWTGH